MIVDEKGWLEAYRSNKSASWIKAILTNDEEAYSDSFLDWMNIKKKCEDSNLFLKKLSLQYRSHKVDIDIDGCDGIYLIRSVMGQIGGDTSQFYTVGKIVGDKVYKQMWVLPELVMDKEYEDTLENCFEEAIIYDKTQKNRQK